ncbi:hypothetical protein MPSI1_002279 [Malassezia psittaci]|uniref:5-hydroxyisourate hydrolase n=1 Tax=Malassezia psittaci TaxID=1821823 RepID=A0AAF0FC84_9BASI|nr:hypothetical protein MPSI1_002279 [Malassezia psittaci]
MTISTHVLDTSSGTPAKGVPFQLLSADDSQIAKGTTNADGRTQDLQGINLSSGTYRMIFDTTTYFTSQNIKDFFYPKVELYFTVTDPESHYHVPLILSPYGFSTYRGS